MLALDGSNWQRVDLFEFQRDIVVSFAKESNLMGHKNEMYRKEIMLQKYTCRIDCKPSLYTWNECMHTCTRIILIKTF